MQNPNITPEEKWLLKNGNAGVDEPSLLYQPNLPLLLFCSPRRYSGCTHTPLPCGYWDLGFHPQPATR